MPHIEIVSHCWNYPSLLLYQLSSLVRYAPSKVQVTMTVWHCDEDGLTKQVLQYISAHHASKVPDVCFRWRSLGRRRLMSRAIGRNSSALETAADLVWFADVDYCFGEGALAALAAEAQQIAADLMFPRTIYQSPFHRDGDKVIELGRAAVARGGELLDIPRDRFTPTRSSRAIGGIQIVRGELAREFGYLPHSRFQPERSEWGRCREDTFYRRSLGAGRGTAVALPNVFRIRHSQCGRIVRGLVL